MAKNTEHQSTRCAAERYKQARLARIHKHNREDAANEKHARPIRRPRGQYCGKVIVNASTAARWKREGGKRMRNELVVSR